MDSSTVIKKEMSGQFTTFSSEGFVVKFCSWTDNWREIFVYDLTGKRLELDERYVDNLDAYASEIFEGFMCTQECLVQP